jgi:hypothetical protein
MNRNYPVALIVLLTCAIFLAGCTGTPPAPAATPTPQVIYVTVTPAPSPPVSPAATPASAPTVAPLPPALIPNPEYTPDRILHRYMFTYPDSSGFMGSDLVMGREIKFYPGGTLYTTGGTVDYRIGYVTEISGNFVIYRLVSEASGDWVPMGNNTYYVKMLPTEQGGAQFIRHFILVPEHTNPSYPGIVYPETLVGSDGTTFIRQKID